jgi:ribonuclease-3
MTQPHAERLAVLQDRIGHTFRRQDLLQRALTHASAADGGQRRHNERLEFLGDRVLGLVIAESLMRRFPDETEGDLARRHTSLVRREALAAVARDIALGEALVLSKGEAESGGRDNPALLADACEAVIAALYLDGGLEAAKRFIDNRWERLIAAAPEPPRDAKTALQEWAQGRGLPLPRYSTVATEGPPHEPLFTVEVVLQGRPAVRAPGRSKRMAEQAAAGLMLDQIEREAG